MAHAKFTTVLSPLQPAPSPRPLPTFRPFGARKAPQNSAPLCLHKASPPEAQLQLRSSRRDLPAAPAARSFDRPASLLSTVAAYADASRNLKRFENAAGRAAMVGTLVAVATELFTDHGLFNSYSDQDLMVYSALVAIGVASGTGVAVQTRSPLGRELTNALILSIKSSISSQGEKPVVDAVVDEIIGPELLLLLATDDEPADRSN